ncbi:MAG TPA: hypothetical protein VGC18_02790 [Lacisediminihabitans sp.]|uniref:hypothetical protein n=1 Tax=Lacisediminihabitans sp. TaxID=2787631 RepID=UPI002ED9963A
MSRGSKVRGSARRESTNGNPADLLSGGGPEMSDYCRRRPFEKGTAISQRSFVLSTLRRLHLEQPARFVHGIARRLARRTEVAATRARQGRRDAGLRRAYHRVLHGDIVFDRFGDAPRPEALAIVVCLWNRPERLADVLRIIDAQRTSRSLRLVLWNNNPLDDEFYRSVIASYRSEGSLTSIELHSSPINIGGMGRFVAMSELVRHGYTGPFIMMDDDQNFDRDFVETLIAAWIPRSIAGVWAWNNSGDYWDRTQVVESGASAMHVGTGGAICDSAIVGRRTFFTRIPMRFLFMEDIWMSRLAQASGWRLTMVDAPVQFVLSELDQGHALFDYKESFYRWLKNPRHIPALLDG